MGLFDSISNLLSGGARNDAAAGYDQANQYLDPYRQQGTQDYNAYRGYVQQQGQNLQPYQHAGDWQYGQINQSPVDYYNQIMSGYNESPQAKYEQEQAIRASNAGGAASGMLGSGAQAKALQEHAADVSARDQQRFFGNVTGANQMQMGYLGNLNNRQDQFNAMQQYLTNLGYGGSQISGQNAVNKGLSNANYDQSAIDQLFQIGGLAGSNYKNNSLYNQTPDVGGQIPWYLMFA